MASESSRQLLVSWSAAHAFLYPLYAKFRVLLQEADRNENRGDQEDQRTDNPHDDRADDLVGHGRHVKGVRLREVVRVDGAVAEGEEGRERGVDDVRANQVRDHGPAWVAGAGRPRADERPPEENRRAEKADVLEVMPAFVLQREVVGGGYVPAQEYQIHGEPRDQGPGEEAAQYAQRLQSKQGAQQGDGEEAGKAAQQRDLRITEKQERGNQGHEKQMLHHVGAEKGVGKAVHRRADGKPED